MIRKVNKLMEGNVYFDNDDLVFTVLKKYLSTRDASWLQRNKQGLYKGDKVIIGEHILGLIAHEYAIHKFGPYVANNVGSVASYFSVMKPLTIDIKTGRVALPQCYLAASNLSRELKKQYNQLTWQLDEVFRDIAEEILVILDEDPIDRGEEIPYEYESMRRNRQIRESADNTFYCAECTYTKSGGVMSIYTTDITEVRRSTMPKDSLKVEGSFLVRRKYFRSEYEAQEYIDSLPNAMPMSRNESFEIHPLKTAKVYHPDFDSFDLFSCDESTKNQFLGRFVADCRYFLGNGNGYEGHLWAGSVEEQIDLMRKLYDDIRPDWLSERQIDEFEDKMLQLKYNRNESVRRKKLREGDASKKTNYAVIVYDMNTGSYNLYTGTKKMCEQLYKDLFDFNIDDYDDDEKDDMYDWLYDRLNEFNCIERIDFRRGIDYRDNYSDGYDIYHIINYTKPRHPISLYL